MSKEEERALQENIAKKIAGHKKYDVERKWETDVDVPYIQNMIENQGEMCHHCQIYLKLSEYKARDREQFSIDRVDDTKGHLKGNVVISCWGCNHTHENRKM